MGMKEGAAGDEYLMQWDDSEAEDSWMPACQALTEFPQLVCEFHKKIGLDTPEVRLCVNNC